MALSCIIFEIKRYICRKLRFDFFHTPCIDAAVRGSRRNIAILFGVAKLEQCGYPKLEKCDDMFSCFDEIPACDRGQTDGRTSCDIIVRAI